MHASHMISPDLICSDIFPEVSSFFCFFDLHLIPHVHQVVDGLE